MCDVGRRDARRRDRRSDGVRGWFPALYTLGQGNDEAKDNHSGRDIPDCP